MSLSTTIRLSIGLLAMFLVCGALSIVMGLTSSQSQAESLTSTSESFVCETTPLPILPEVGPPQRGTLSPIAAENVNRLATLSEWNPVPEEGDPSWQLSSLFFDPNSGLLARLQTGAIFFQMGAWHLWDISDPFLSLDLGTVPGTGYDYTYWTYTDVVFIPTGYARARVYAQFPNAAQDWGGSATPNQRWIAYQRSGEPEVIVREDYIGQPYSPDVQLELSADGSRILVYFPGMLYVWDASQAQTIASVSLGGSPRLVGFSPHNQVVVTVEGENIIFRRIESGDLSQILSIPIASGEFPVLQFMPGNNSRFVRATGIELEVWNLSTPILESTHVMPCVAAKQMAFSPDGALLAISADCSTTAGRHASEVQIWQTDTMGELASLPVDMTVTDLAFSPDGYLLAMGDAGHTEVWGIVNE